MGKILFIINVQSISDIITNSSSELFVFQKPSVKEITKLLDTYVPGWKNEYKEPILFSNMDVEDQNYYIDWVTDLPAFYCYDDDIERYNKDVIKTVHRKLCVPEDEVPSLFNNWNQPVISSNNNYTWIHYNLEWSEKGLKLLRDKYKYDICLWSLYENPNYERLKQIEMLLGGKRYHLG